MLSRSLPDKAFSAKPKTEDCICPKRNSTKSRNKRNSVSSQLLIYNSKNDLYQATEKVICWSLLLDTPGLFVEAHVPEQIFQF